jgi:hypothetical protein
MPTSLPTFTCADEFWSVKVKICARAGVIADPEARSTAAIKPLLYLPTKPFILGDMFGCGLGHAFHIFIKNGVPVKLNNLVLSDFICRRTMALGRFWPRICSNLFIDKYLASNSLIEVLQ